MRKHYLSWAGGSDPFDPDARLRPLAPQTLRLRRDQIHAAVTALAKFGYKFTHHSFARRPSNAQQLKEHSAPSTWRWRTAATTFSITCSPARSFKSRASGSRSIQRFSLTLSGWFVKSRCRHWASRQKQAVSAAVRRSRRSSPPSSVARQVWAEVKRDSQPSFRTLAKAHVAIAIAILTYLPVRLQNLSDLTFDTHLFLNAGAGATSTLELSNGEVKNKRELAFDVPPRVTKMLLEYRDRIAPKILGHRPKRLFVNQDGSRRVQDPSQPWCERTQENGRHCAKPASVSSLECKSSAGCATGSFRNCLPASWP